MEQIESPKIPIVEMKTGEDYYITLQQLLTMFKEGNLNYREDAVFPYAWEEGQDKPSGWMTYREIRCMVQVGKELEEEE